MIQHLLDEWSALESLQLVGPGVHVEAQISKLLQYRPQRDGNSYVDS